MSIQSYLMCVARSKVFDIIGKVTKQKNVIHESVRNEMQKFMQEVMDGIWVGDGANKFISSIQEECLPRIDVILDGFADYSHKLETCVHIIDDADSQCRGEIQRLRDEFEQIVNF